MSDASTTPPPPADQPTPADGMTPQSFFGALFDFGFTSHVTPRVVSVLYVLGMIGIVLSYLLWTLQAFNVNSGFGVVVLLIIGPIMSVLLLEFLRVTLEFFVALVRLSGDFREWREEWRLRS